jgi:hypothetical protein
MFRGFSFRFVNQMPMLVSMPIPVHFTELDIASRLDCHSGRWDTGRHYPIRSGVVHS